jgi:hypothetical protein
MWAIEPSDAPMPISRRWPDEAGKSVEEHSNGSGTDL